MGSGDGGRSTGAPYRRSALVRHVPGPGHPEVGEARVHPIPLDERRRVVDVPEALERRQHVRERLLRGLLQRVDDELGMLRRLVRIVHARESGDLPGQRLLVEPLRIPVRGDLLHGRVHVHLDERADLGAHRVPRLPVRGDRTTDRRDAVAGQQLRDEPDPEDVRVAVILREPQALRQVLADDVAVEDLGLQPSRTELVVEHLRDRRFPGAGEAREPHREAAGLDPVGQTNLRDVSSPFTPKSDRIVGPTSTRFSPSTAPIGCPGAPFITNTPLRSWLAPSGPTSFSYVYTLPVPTAPTDRQARSPKYTSRSGATPRTSGYTPCGLSTFLPRGAPSGPDIASSFVTSSSRTSSYRAGSTTPCGSRPATFKNSRP